MRLLGLAGGLSLGCSVGTPSPARSLLSRHAELPVVIAHRGASAHAPENTLAAYRKALELKVPAAETDVWLSADGRVVVLHDDTLERTTNGVGSVERTPWADIQRLDAGSWFDPAFAGEPVPDLDGLLELVADQLVLCVEIKGGKGVVGRIATVLERHPEQRGQVVIFSFKGRKLERVHELMPDIPTLWLARRSGEPRRYPSDVVAHAVKLGVKAIGFNHQSIERAHVVQAHEAGLPVFVYTVDEPADVRRVVELGVDGIIANAPDRVNEELARIQQARSL